MRKLRHGNIPNRPRSGTNALLLREYLSGNRDVVKMLGEFHHEKIRLAAHGRGPRHAKPLQRNNPLLETDHSGKITSREIISADFADYTQIKFRIIQIY